MTLIAKIIIAILALGWLIALVDFIRVVFFGPERHFFKRRKFEDRSKMYIDELGNMERREHEDS